MRNSHNIKLQKRFAGMFVIFSMAGLLFSLLLKAQPNTEKGLPFISNYRYQDYNAGGVNWWAAEDDKGVMYFANNNGILVYDGQQWELVKLPDNPEARSLVKGDDGKIYAGTNGDIGYVGPGAKGKLQFISLKNKLPEKHRLFQQVWECGKLGGNVYFRTNHKIFFWDYKSFRVLESNENAFHMSAVINDRYYVRIWNRGLTVLKEDSFHVVPNGEQFTNERIYVMLPFDEQRILIGTRTQGLFLYDGKGFTPFKTEADQYIFNTSLYGGIVLDKDKFALNTFNDGMVIIDRQGKLIRRIDKSVGLQDNSIDYLFEDSRGILWMPLFNGIAKLDLRSSLSFYNESMGLPAKTVFNAVSYNDTIYAGTNNGVYMLNKSTNRFQLVPGTSGQVYSFIRNDNDFLAGGAEKGLLKIIGGKAYPVIPGINYDFHIRQLYRSSSDTNIIYVLLRSGIAAVRYNASAPAGRKYTVESFRNDLITTFGGFLERKDGQLWVVDVNSREIKLVNPVRSSGKVNLENASVKKYNYKQGLPQKPINISSYDGKPYFFSERDSVFIFDEKQDRFVPDTTSFLKNYIVNDADFNFNVPTDHLGRIWANFGTGVFVKIPTKDGSLKIIDAPFREMKKNYPVWAIDPTLDKKGKPVVWFAGREGIIRYDGNLDETSQVSFNTIIRGITLNDDSVFFTGFTLPADKAEFSNKWNTVRFQYAAPFFKLENETVFSTYLEGRDKNWSEWTKQNFREFGNLSSGTYTFRVKARNIYDIESPEAFFSFNVLPPWYATWWAYALYAILAIGLIYLIVRYRTRHLHAKHKELEKTVALRTAELSHRVEELAVINSVQEGLVREIGMQDIYELVGEKIREIFNAQVIDIVTYDRKTNLIEDQYAYEKGDRTLLGAREPNGLRKALIETGQPQIINKDFEKISQQYNTTILIGLQPKSAILLPMISGGEVKGMISLQDLDKENAFSDSDISLLTTLANSMSVALESARRFDETNRLLKETEQRNAELAVINSVQDGLVREMDIQGIYYLVGEKIREIFDAQVIDIVTYDRKTNLIDDKYAYEKGDRTLLNPREPKGFRKHIIETGEQLVINEEAAKMGRQYNNQVMVGEEPKSLVMVPMITGGQVTGIISLQNVDREHAFSDSNVRLINTLANSMSIALESARLFDETKRLLKETEQRTAELSVINSVQEGLAKELNIQGIYELVGEKMRQIFSAQVIDIVTYDSGTDLMEDRYAFEKGDRTLAGTWKPYGFRKRVIDTGQLLVINEGLEKKSIEFNSKVLLGEQPKSAVFVPLISGNEVKGMISLQNLDHEHAFSNSNINLLTTLANSMTVALESARLFDETNRLLKETEQRTAELAVINSVQEGLAKELDMNAIYDLVGNKIRDVFDAQAVGIATLDQETGSEIFNYMIEKGERFYPAPRPYDKLRHQLIRTKQKILINNNMVGAFREFGLKVVEGSEMPKSILYVPLIAGDKVTSYVTLQNIDKENAFSDSDVRLLETLANSMSVALESARLFDETTRLLKETEQRTAELAVINSVQEGLAKELDMQGIYDLVGDRVQKLFNAQVVIIATFDHEKKLEYFNYHIEKGEITHPDPRHFDKVRQHLIQTGQNIMINENFPKAAAEFGMKVVPGTEAPKSLLFMPLKVGEKVTGYVSLQNIDEENAFSFSDVRLLGTLSNSMSVALENARLFDETNRLLKETEQRTAELAVINSVQEGLAKELDMQGIYNLVGDRVQKLFNAQSIIIASFDLENKIEHFNYLFENGEYFKSESRSFNKVRQLLIDKKYSIYIPTSEQSINEYGLTTAIGGSQLPKSLLFVPLLTGNIIRGYVSLQNIDKENAFSESDIRLLETLANSMSVALENARLFDETNRLLKETEQRNAELAVINSVQESLVAEMDMQGIYELVGEKMREIFKAQVIDIVTYDRNTNLIEDRYAFEKGDRTLLGAREPKGFRKHVIETGEMLLHNENVEEASRQYNNDVLIGEMSKSQIFFPLIASGKVNGIISLQNLDHEHAFSESDVSLITTLANSMSVALESARLFDETNRLLKETEQRTAELAVINSVQEGLARELDMQGIYNLIGDRVQKLFNAQSVIIASFDLDNKTEYFNYFFENDEKVKADSRPVDKLRQLLIDKKHSIYISTEKQAREEYGLTPIAGTQMTKSLLFVPLLTGNIIRGYVSLQNIDTENAFSDSDIRLLETVANSMSVALENARLFDETTRLLKETEQRTAELGIINNVQEGLASKLDIQAIYDLVGDKIRDVFDTQGISISFYDRKKNFITHPYYLFKGNRIAELGFELGKGLTSHIIKTGQPLLINENAAERFKELGAVFASSETEETTKSWLGVPLISGGQVNGTIRLENYEREFAYSESDLSLLQTLANSMSVALENARLFDETTRLLKETEQRNAELAVINSVQESLVAQMDMQGIYELVGEKMREIFNVQVIDIVTYDRKTNLIEDRYAYEKGDRTLLGTREPKGFRKHVIKTGQMLVINKEVEKLRSEYDNTVIVGQASKSLVLVPLIAGGEVTGVISLQNLDQEDAFSDSDVSLLATLVNSMSVALKSASLFDETTRLLKETEHRKAELAVINNVQEGLVKEFKSKAIYELVGEKLCELFDTQTVLIRTFEQGTGLEVWRYAIEKGQRQYSEPRPLIWANKQMIETHQPILINENYLETAKKFGGSGVSMGQPPKSAVFVPMMVGDDVRGSVSLQNVDKEHAFNESDLRLLSTLTNSMGVALENARLFDETTLLLAEAKQRATELSTVNNISKALASQLDPDDLINLVGDQLKDLFKANIVYLALLNKKTKTIHFPYQYGDDNIPMKLGEGLTSKIILTGEPLLINKDVEELRAKLGVQSMGIPAASYLGVPIPVGDEIIGVLSVQSTEHENKFNENDLRLLSTIASSVGVALRNAQLFEEVQQSKMEAEAASKFAEKANEAKSAFLSTVSHELRTPLTSVLGFAKIIRKRLDEKIFPVVNKRDPKTDKTINQISDNLQVVISEGERLTHLINDVLDLAKIEAGKMEWNQENVSMPEVAERAIAATTSLYEQKSLKLIKEIDPNLPEITGDKDKLIQVIINLISNSVKFTDEGSITCRVYQEKEDLIVSISDTGIGIAPEDFDAVFEQFKQVGGDTLTDKPKGTGLGLPICKEIVEHHGGRIWLASDRGKGSTFSFALPIIAKTEFVKPLHLNDLVRQLKEQMAQSKFNLNGNHATILVVDDDDSIRSLLNQELGDAGYIIEQAANGKEALACVRNHRPDLIILDVMMPEMNGFDVAAILKNDPETMDIPIIVLSIVQDKARGFRIGVDRYLTKPINTAQLFTEVGSLLEQGKSRKKVMVVDEDSTAVRTLTEVLQAKGYQVVESDGKELVEKAILNQPDIIILNSVVSDKHEIVQSLRFEKGLENVLFLIYQ